MKIGIFDSGMGGLIIAHSIIDKLPQYDYLYLGDTARVPYGNRSPQMVYQFTHEAVSYLFEHDCNLVIVACNTASAEAVRRLQREYLPDVYPDRHILGVLVPTAEAAVQATKSHRIGVLATVGTVASGAYKREIHKLSPGEQVMEQAAPLLVPIVEHIGTAYAPAIIRDYLAPLKAAKIDTLVLGCTHYPFLKSEIRRQMGEAAVVVSPDEVVPESVAAYLDRHPDTAKVLGVHSQRQFYVTDLTDSNQDLEQTLFGNKVKLEQVDL